MRHPLILAAIAAVLLLVGAILYTMLSLRHNITTDSVAAITRGMTRAEVESILGGPPGRYYRWRQASPILLPDPYLAGGEDEWIADDYAVFVRFDASGRVVSVRQPVGMHHGGPYPATTSALHTSVGMTAVDRFTRPIAFQDAPPEALPPELREDNPLGIRRRVDGVPA